MKRRVRKSDLQRLLDRSRCLRPWGFRVVALGDFEQGTDISDTENVVKIGASVGCNAEELRAALNDQAVKDKTRSEVDAAVAKGVCGSPCVVVDCEPFWGVDRFHQIERWLRDGPF